MGQCISRIRAHTSHRWTVTCQRVDFDMTTVQGVGGGVEESERKNKTGIYNIQDRFQEVKSQMWTTKKIEFQQHLGGGRGGGVGSGGDGVLGGGSDSILG